MKGSTPETPNIWKTSLYIPHGSDESRKGYSIIKRTSRLYIPHGSDESFCQSVWFGQFWFFISHMVQMKEAPQKRPTLAKSTFISHMVQMKVVSGYINKNELSNFISHMVQMKVKHLICSLTMLFPLYPTWFRWKTLLCPSLNAVSYLYIPHGSDESIDPSLNTDSAYIFISHMVQMKVNSTICFLAVFFLYIPHGSDESGVRKNT